jgi:DNA-binding NarL/FixJ family response regulator
MRENSGPIRVLVADSTQMQSQLLTSALRRRPEFAVTSCAKSDEAILRVAGRDPLDVAVLTGDKNGGLGTDLALIRRFHLSHPKVAKVMLTESYNRELVVNAFRSGVRGIFCYSETPFRALCKCIRCVYHGQVWANSQQLAYLMEAMASVQSLRVVNANGSQLLTERERQVVALVADGLSNREVARELNLTHNTIKKYLFRIFDKLGISSRVELVLYAMNHGDSQTAEWMSGG